MYKLLIVEDDIGIAEGIKKIFDSWSFEVSVVSDFRAVLEVFREEKPHIVLLDISLPFYNGFYWCTQIRCESNVPIVIISSASDNMNMVMAMNMGADDFIAKPFNSDVLVAKVQALLRRAYDFTAPSRILESRGALLDTDNGTLCFENKKIELTKNEYRILLTLFESKGKIVSRERLMERLWETDSFVDDNTLTVNINRLRKKLSASGLEELITTKFGMGYLVG